MLVLKTSINKPDEKVIRQTVKVLNNNGIIIYPTDTAYGLGGNALMQNVVKKIYQIKCRDFSKPTHVIVKDWKMINEISFINNYAKAIYDNILPGPLTIILKKKNQVPNILTAGLDTLGVRIPDCEVTRSISQQLNFPYTTPSANRSGGNTPYSIQEAMNELCTDQIDLAIDCGTLPKTKPSTIVDLTTKPVKILREGPVNKRILMRVLKEFVK